MVEASERTRGEASAIVAEPEDPPKVGTFSAFASPAFRFYWASTAAFFLIQGMQRFAYVWLVIAISDRAGVAGMAGFALGIPAFLIMLPAGVWSDRHDRRRLIVGSHAVATAAMLAVAVLIWSDLMTVEIALLSAVAVGATTAVSTPPIQAIVPSLVPGERLMNAIVLKNMGQNLAMLLGAGVGGGVIAIWGIGAGFAAQAVAYAIAASLMVVVRLPARPADEDRRSMRAEISAGIRFVIADRRLLVLMLLSMVTGLFMLGPVFVLLPEIAKDRLGQEAFTASLLFLITSGGMFAMSFVLASRQAMPNKGRLFMVALAISGPIVSSLGLSGWYPLTALMMFAWGLGGGIFVNINQTLVQLHTPPEMMGRVMAIYSLAIAGFMPLGSLLAGIGASAIGASEWLVFCGAVLAPVALLALFTQGSLRRMS
jgi:MFS family permease